MQTNFPKDLYKVKSYALRAKPTKAENTIIETATKE